MVLTGHYTELPPSHYYIHVTLDYMQITSILYIDMSIWIQVVHYKFHLSIVVVVVVVIECPCYPV